MTLTRAQFIATLFGAKFVSLTQEQYDSVLPLAEDELRGVLCWCPDIYLSSLAMKIALMLDGIGVGTGAPAAPVAIASELTHDAYVVEDEVYDIKRKYRLIPKSQQVVASGPAATLQGIIDRCKPRLKVGAVLGGRFKQCCGGGIGDKTEVPYGGSFAGGIGGGSTFDGADPGDLVSIFNNELD